MSDSPTPFSATRRKPNPWVIAGVAVIHIALFYGLIRALAPGAVQSVERSVVSAFTVTVTTGAPAARSAGAPRVLDGHGNPLGRYARR